MATYDDEIKIEENPSLQMTKGLTSPSTSSSDDKYLWKNLSEDQKDKVLASTVSFQGIKMSFKQMNGEDLSICNYLSSKAIKNILDGKEFQIGRSLEPKKDEIYMPRRFMRRKKMDMDSGYTLETAPLPDSHHDEDDHDDKEEDDNEEEVV